MLITIFKLNPRGAETCFRESRWWWWPSLGPIKELAPSPLQVVSIPSSSIIGSGRNLVEWGVSHVVKHDSKADLEKLMYKTFILTPSLKMSTSLLRWWLGGHGRLGRYSWELWDFYCRVCVCGVQKVVAVPVSTPPATALIFISQKDAIWCESVGLEWAYSEQEIFMIPRAMNQVFSLS